MKSEEEQIIKEALDYFYGFHYRGKRAETSQPYENLINLIEVDNEIRLDNIHVSNNYNQTVGDCLSINTTVGDIGIRFHKGQDLASFIDKLEKTVIYLKKLEV